jgi:hypothetical protein
MPIQMGTGMGIKPCNMTTYNLFYIPSLDPVSNSDYIESGTHACMHVTAAATFNSTNFTALTIIRLSCSPEFGQLKH